MPVIIVIVVIASVTVGIAVTVGVAVTVSSVVMIIPVAEGIVAVSWIIAVVGRTSVAVHRLSIAWGAIGHAGTVGTDAGGQRYGDTRQKKKPGPIGEAGGVHGERERKRPL